MNSAARSPATAERRVVRCGIYTRKSSDDRLIQEINSLDVQREACAAFVDSQRHEGWVLSPERYDDAAFSGGNMARPALQRLLTDVRSRNIDIIVVYKIDRLTRSLADFAKIMEILDAAEASFVSITQTFNSSTSMGRLTLNVLLSFAQFERELGSERVRDKIAASKAQGMWTGGGVPLGYDILDRRLVINPKEASLVRRIMETYLECGSVPNLLATLEAEGVRTKRHVSRKGNVKGGIIFKTGSIRHLLANETYLGKTKHKGTLYPGQHEPIISEDLWKRVQALTASNTVKRRCGLNARNPSLLAGMIHDRFGRRMSPAHTRKGNRKHRYYASNNAAVPQPPASFDRHTPVWRLRAEEIEDHVRRGLGDLIGSPDNVLKLVGDGDNAELSEAFGSRARALVNSLSGMSRQALRKLLLDLGLRVTVHEKRVQLACDCESLRHLLQGRCDSAAGDARAGETIAVDVPNTLTRRPQGLRVVLKPLGGEPDPALVNLLIRARAARKQLFSPAKAPIPAEKRVELVRMARLSFLAPDIVSAILNGDQPKDLAVSRLTDVDLHLAWPDQRRQLGFCGSSNLRSNSP